MFFSLSLLQQFLSDGHPWAEQIMAAVEAAYQALEAHIVAQFGALQEQICTIL